MESIFTVVFMCIAYIICMCIVKDCAETMFHSYVIKVNGVVSLELREMLMKRKVQGTFVLSSMLLFPLFICFACGYYIGTYIYTILIGNNDEDRIASWLV